jgi:hypothetical protein
MKPWLTLALLALAGCAVRSNPSPGALDDDFVPSYVSDLEPSIFIVKTGGYWEEDDVSGRYRVAVIRHCSPEHCFTDTYLQWVRSQPEDTALQGVVTVPIGEINDSILFVKDARFGEDAKGVVIELRVMNTYTEAENILRVWPTSRGLYDAEYDHQ